MHVAIDREPLDKLFEVLARHGVDRLEWVVYWYSDEGHFDDYRLLDARGEMMQVGLAEDLSPATLDEVLWAIIEAYDDRHGAWTGLFRLGIGSRTVQRLADSHYDVEVEELPEDAQECIAL